METGGPEGSLVHQRRAWRYRVRRIDDHRQGFVIDRDELGGVARLRFARGEMTATRSPT